MGEGAWRPTEAGCAEPLIGHWGGLLREDSLEVAVEVGWDVDRDRLVAAVDSPAAAEAAEGVLLSWDGERQGVADGGRGSLRA